MCTSDDSQDWLVNHGRSIGLGIALKDAADQLMTPEYQPRIKKALVAFTSADRVNYSFLDFFAGMSDLAGSSLLWCVIFINRLCIIRFRCAAVDFVASHTGCAMRSQLALHPTRTFLRCLLRLVRRTCSQ